jgi:hypothetical protein
VHQLEQQEKQKEKKKSAKKKDKERSSRKGSVKKSSTSFTAPDSDSDSDDYDDNNNSDNNNSNADNDSGNDSGWSDNVEAYEDSNDVALSCLQKLRRTKALLQDQKLWLTSVFGTGVDPNSTINTVFGSSSDSSYDNVYSSGAAATQQRRKVSTHITYV